MRLALFLLIAVTGIINIECRPQQIIIRQNPSFPLVNPPHLVPSIRSARPTPMRKYSDSRRPRHTGHPLVKKSSKNVYRDQKHMHVVPAPNLGPVAKPSQSIPPQIQARNQRQVSQNIYKAPIIKYSSSPAHPKEHLTIVPAPRPRSAVKLSQSIPPPKQVRNERQVSTSDYNALTTNFNNAPVTPKVFVNVVPAPKQRSVVKPPQSIPTKQVRNERQVSKNNYKAPLSNYNPAPAANSYKTATTTTIEAQPTTIEARQLAIPTQPEYKAAGRSRQPIAITRYLYNSPTGEEEEGDDVFNYEFESENGIKQSAQGTMRMVNDTPVVVMRGSYEYVDNGVTYEVVWEADENGFRPSAPKSKHLPQVVPIPFPEQQAAVDAQIRFAAEETRLRAAASENPASYIATNPSLSSYSEGRKRV